jgi:membrane protein implicated in regulation of membrane protease activity
MKEYRKFFVALGITVLMGIHSAISDGSLILPIPKHWELVCLAAISAVLVVLVRNGDKPAVEKK